MFETPTRPNKPGRVARSTEPMDAVEIAEIELEGVMGGCARCGCTQANPQPQQPANTNR